MEIPIRRATSHGMADHPVPEGYAVLTPEALPGVLADLAGLADRLGGGPEAWSVTEISDGNMNAVFRVRGPKGGVVAKQALPYIRVIGPDWPFPVSRATFEARAAEVHGAAAPGRVVEILAFVDRLGLIVMEDLARHVVLRHALARGETFPGLARQFGEYLADSLVGTSDFALSTSEKNSLADRFSGNTVPCETTQDVVFTGPYWNAPLNRLTPGQEDLAAALRADPDLVAAAARMKHRFRSRAEALIHGDLHTGSVMVTPADTRVIDAEWAFMGPMGFDIGAFLGNVLLAHASQPGHGEDRVAQADWLLRLFEETWEAFAARARSLLRPATGGVLVPELAQGTTRLFVDAWLSELWSDTLGFAGCKMIRRIIGISHVEDFEWIEDVRVRAACEAEALHLARRLLVDRRAFPTARDVTASARSIRARGSRRGGRAGPG